MQKFLLSIVFLGFSVVGFGQSIILSEGFESGLPGSYTTGSVTLSSGTWTVQDVFPESSGNSRSGSKAARINDDKSGAHLTTPSLNTVGTVTFYYRELNSGGGTFALQKSISGGAFTTVTTHAYSGNTFTQFSFDVDDASSDIKIRVLSDDNSGHLIIDDFEVTDFNPLADPEVEFIVTEISATEGDASVTVDLSISDIPSENITVGIRDASGTTAILDDGSAFDESVTFPSGNGANQTLTIDLDAAYSLADCATESVVLEIYTVSVGTADIGATSEVTLTLDADFCPCSDGTIAIQDFDGSTTEWTYSSNVAFFDNGSDGFFGITNSSTASTGMSGDFLTVNDLDDEGDNGTGGFATITFDDVDVSDYENITLEFDYDINGFDSGDEVEYEVYEGASLSNSQGRVELCNGCTSDGTVSVSIADGTATVGFRLYIKQNGGSDDASFDNFELTGTCLELPCSAPTTLASGGSATATGETTAEISYTKNEGDGTVAIASTTATAATPASGTALPSLGAAFQGGTVVYVGTDASLSNESISGLTAATDYYIHVFEYETEGSDAPCYSDEYTFGTFTTDCDAPETQASAASTDDLEPTSVTIDFTRGNGSGVLVVARQGSAVNTDPTLQTNYTANASFGSGDEIGTGNFVVYKGAATSFPITGLAENTDYHLAFYEYNASGGDYCFFQTQYTFDFTSALECVAPSTASTFTSVSAIDGSSATINTNRTSADGDEYILVLRTTGTPSAPVGGTTYTSNTDYSAAAAMEGVGKIVYKGTATNPTVTGLTPGATYNIDIHELNDNGNHLNPCYTSNTGAGSFTTQDVDVAFEAASSTVDENAGTASVVLSVSNNLLTSDATVRLTYATNDATQPSVTDGATQDVTITAGLNEDITVDIDLTDNFVCDNTSESITLTLTYLAGDDRVTIGGQSTHTITITENEAEPTNQASAPVASNIRSAQASLSWTAGSDAYGTLVAVKAGSGAIITDPVTGTAYAASATYDNGQSDLGSGAYVVYANTGNSLTVSGLTAGTTYTAAFYAYNGDNCYNTTNPVTVEFTTTETSIEFEQATAAILESGDLEVCLTIANNDNGTATEVTLSGDASAFTGTKTISFPANSNATQCVTLTHSTANSTCDSYSNLTLSLIGATNGAVIGANNELDVTLEDDEFYLSSATIFSQDFESGTAVNYTLSETANTTDDPDDGNVFNGAEDGEYIWDFSSNAINTGDIGISSTTGVYWLIEDPIETGGFGSADGNEPTRTAPLSMLFNNVDMGTANAYRNVEVSFYTYFDNPADYSAGELQYGITYDGSEPTSYSNISLATGSTVIGVADRESKVRLKLLANYDGDNLYTGWDNITITGEQCVTCNQPTDVQYTSTVDHTYINAGAATINFSGASADGVLVVAEEAGEITNAPSNRTTYTANNTLGSGDHLGGGEYVVYDGSGGSFTLSGLTEGETYYLKFFDYNNHPTSGDPCYGLSGKPTTYEFTHINGAITYTYVGANGSANFTTATNWSPNRVTEAATDKLLFVTGTDVDLTDVSSQTITHLGVYGDATVGLQGSSASETLSISDSGSDSAEVVVAATATLKGATSDAINFDFGTDVTAEIHGTFAPNGGDLSISENLTIASNAALTFTSGDLTNNGTIAIADDGSLIQGTGSTITGSGTYQVTRNKPDGQASNLYNFWSTPLASTVLMSEMNASLKYELNAPGTSTADWSIVPGSTALEIGKGYALTGITTHTFNGTVNNGTLTIAAERDQATGEEFNVIGNPYPSAINALDFCTENSSIVDGYISLFNHNDGLEYTSANQQITINNLGATVAGNTDEEQTLSNTYIASCQGFYAPLLNNVDGDLITFTNAMRGGDNSDFKSNSSNGILGKFWLHLVNGSREYTTLIGVAEDATWSYDWGWDVKSNNSSGYFINSQLPDGTSASIQTVGALSQTALIPLGIAVPTAGDYQIKLVSSKRMDFGGLTPYLLDTEDHISHNLLESPFTFQAYDASTYTERFYIVFRKANVTTSVKEQETSQSIVLATHSTGWEISSPDPIASVFIGTLDGKKIVEVQSNSNPYKVTVAHKDIPKNTLLIIRASLANGDKKSWTTVH